MIPKVDSDFLLHLTPSLSHHTQKKVSCVTTLNRCRRWETGRLEELALSDFPRCFRWTMRSCDIQSVFSFSPSVESFTEGKAYSAVLVSCCGLTEKCPHRLLNMNISS